MGYHPLNPFRHFGAEARGAFGRGGNPWDAAEGGGGISKLFQPPLQLLFHGSFADARATAKEKKKWLLVNIQKEDIFASHLLNRDVWADELIHSMIKEGFIFWQMSAGLPEAMSYLARYHLEDDGSSSSSSSEGASHLPHIGVLDPRTQRLVWSHEGALPPHQLADKLTEITSTYSLDDHTSVLPPPRPPPVRRPAQSAYDRSEDEQLALALAASMKDAEPSEGGGGREGGRGGRGGRDEIVELDDDSEEDEEEGKGEDELIMSPPAKKVGGGGGGGVGGGKEGGRERKAPPVYDVHDDDDDDDLADTPAAAAAAAAAASPSPLPSLPPPPAYLSYELEPEPAVGAAGVTRVRIRLPQGKTLTRRFLINSPVAALYKYAHEELVKEEGEGGEGGREGGVGGFELVTMYPPKVSLEGEVEKGTTLGDAKLQNSSLSVVLP